MSLKVQNIRQEIHESMDVSHRDMEFKFQDELAAVKQERFSVEADLKSRIN
jgi:hypothetical protein